MYFAGASCRSGRNAPRISTAGNQPEQHNAANFTTTHKHSLSGAEFPSTRNVATAPDLKPVPVVSSKTDNPPPILPSNLVLPPATFVLPASMDRFTTARRQSMLPSTRNHIAGVQALYTELTNSESAVARHRFLAVVQRPRYRVLPHFPASLLPMLQDDRFHPDLAQHHAASDGRRRKSSSLSQPERDSRLANHAASFARRIRQRQHLRQHC